MAASNPVRGLFAGGFAPSDGTNLIDYITIATLGNATNFGDLTRRSLCRFWIIINSYGNWWWR